MFSFLRLRKDRILQLTGGAEQYFQAAYKPAPKKPRPAKTDIHYSVDTDEESRHKVRYSLELNDGYDEDSVAAAMSRLLRETAYNPAGADIDAYLNRPFVDKLQELIARSGRSAAAIYKAAGIDRRLFSKIKSERWYTPAKDTCISLALALQLDLTETNDLLSRAGHTLSHSSRRDVILEYLIREGSHRLAEVNEVLFRLNEKPLGR